MTQVTLIHDWQASYTLETISQNPFFVFSCGTPLLSHFLYIWFYFHSSIIVKSTDTVSLWFLPLLPTSYKINTCHFSHAGRSEIGRLPNLNRDTYSGHCRLLLNYFAPTPVYPPHVFRRRFRMQKDLFMRIVNTLGENDVYFTQQSDALGRWITFFHLCFQIVDHVKKWPINCVHSPGKLGLSPIQKCTAAIRQLAYGTSGDAQDEYVRIGESNTVLSGCHTSFWSWIHAWANQHRCRTACCGWLRTWISWYARLTGLYALDLEELPKGISRSLYRSWRPPDCNIGGGRIVWPMDLACIFWLARILERHQCARPQPPF